VPSHSTGWTIDISEFLLALYMNQMPAPQIKVALCRVHESFKANWTLRLPIICDTLMCCIFIWHAISASLAMGNSLPRSSSTHLAILLFIESSLRNGRCHSAFRDYFRRVDRQRMCMSQILYHIYCISMKEFALLGTLDISNAQLFQITSSRFDIPFQTKICHRGRVYRKSRFHNMELRCGLNKMNIYSFSDNEGIGESCPLYNKCKNWQSFAFSFFC
jgi:hypothetical protein